MAVDVRLPVLGDFMQEGTLVEWLRPDGARVTKGEPLYRLETDKVSLDVEAPADGVLRQVAAAGAVVPVNGLLGRIVEAEQPTGAAGPVAAAGTTALTPALSQGERGPAAGGGAGVGDAGTGALAEDEVRAWPAEEEVRASPAARRLARELGVDIGAVARANPGARLREAHVQAFAAAQPAGGFAAAPIPAVPVTPGAANRQPLTGRRRVIAQRMQQSLQQMAQLTVSQQVDVTECVRLREQLVRLWAADGVRPTYTDFVVRAAALALREHPTLNATLEDDALILHDRIDVGLAVDAPEGLIVPVLRGVDGLSLRELVGRAAAAAEQARANRLGPDALQGGTFTVTTLGALGIDFFTPIVNPPQVAIIGIGRVFSQLVLVNGQVTERQAMYLNLSFDHRAVAGAPAARFLNRVKELLELPVGLL